VSDDTNTTPDSSTDATQNNDVATTDVAKDTAQQDTSTQDAGWTPTSLVGLAFWYSAASPILSTGNVVGWTDLSTNHNDATVSHGAVVVHANAVKGAHDALTFSTAAMSVADSSSLQWGAASDFVVAIVGSYTSPGNAGTYFIHKLGPYVNSNAIGWMAYAGPDGQLWTGLSYNGPFVKAGTGVNDGVFRIFVSRRKNGGASLETRVNGVPVSGTVAPQNVNTTQPMIIGSYDANASQQSLTGDIAEIIGARGSISDTDVAAIEAFLKAKYGL
jgi:hypothetical protein